MYSSLRRKYPDAVKPEGLVPDEEKKKSKKSSTKKALAEKRKISNKSGTLEVALPAMKGKKRSAEEVDDDVDSPVARKKGKSGPLTAFKAKFDKLKQKLTKNAYAPLE